MGTEDWGPFPSRPTSFTCPECKGAIHEIREEGLIQLSLPRGPRLLLARSARRQGQGVEESLWVALQTLEERAQMLELMAADDRQRGRHRGAGSYDVRARETREHADRLRELLRNLPV